MQNDNVHIMGKHNSITIEIGNDICLAGEPNGFRVSVKCTSTLSKK